MAYKLWKGDIEASDLISGELADARISSSSVTQHKAALEGTLELGNLQVSTIDMGLSVIKLSSNPTTDKHAARKKYVDDQDTILSGRLDAIEGGMVAGVIWQASLANMVDLNGLDEAAVELGWAYYVQATKDVFVVVPGTEGDHKPADWDSYSFLKIADFNELSGLVSTEQAARITAVENEKARAEAAEGANASAIASEQSRAEAAEAANANAISAEATARAAAISAEALARGTADTAATQDRAAISAQMVQNETNRDQAIATRSGVVDGLITGLTQDVANEAAARAAADTAETNRATAAEQVNANAIAAEAVRAGNAETANADAIAAEVTRAGLAETANSDAIAAEVTRATAAESANTNLISQEVTRAGLAEAANANAITAEATTRASAISSEQSARTTAVANLQSQIDSILSNTDPAALDSLTEIVNEFQSADTTLSQTITGLLGTHSSNLDGEVAAREAAINTLTTALTDEVARATTAETANALAVVNEATRASQAESVNAASISAEATRASQAEAAIQASLDGEIARATAAEAAVGTAAASARTALEAALRQGTASSSFTGSLQDLKDSLDTFISTIVIGQYTSDESATVQAWDKTLSALANSYHDGQAQYIPVYSASSFSAPTMNTVIDISGPMSMTSPPFDPSDVNLTSYSDLSTMWPSVDFSSVDLSGSDSYGNPFITGQNIIDAQNGSLTSFPIDLQLVLGSPTGGGGGHYGGSSASGEADSVMYVEAGRLPGSYVVPITDYWLYGASQQISSAEVKYAGLFDLTTSQLSVDDFTVNLAAPNQDYMTGDLGRVIIFKVDALQNNGAQPVTLRIASTGMIDGQSEFVFDHAYQSVKMIGTTSGWKIIS